MNQGNAPGDDDLIEQQPVKDPDTVVVECASRAVIQADTVDFDWTRTFDYQTLIQEELDEYSNIQVTHDLREGGIHAQKAWGYWFKFLSEEIWKTSLQNEVVTFCNSINNPRILSLGCGYGGVELTIASSLKKPYDLVALDINEQIFARGREEAKAKGYPITFLPLDLNYVNVRDKSFDLIFAHASLHHLLNLEHVFRQVYNGLRPDGRLIVQDIIGRTQVLFWKENVECARNVVRHMPAKYVTGIADRETIIPAYVEPAIQKGMEGIRQEEIEEQIDQYFVPLKMFRYGSFMRMICTHPVIGQRIDPDLPSDRIYLDTLCRNDLRQINDKSLRPTELLAVYTKRDRVDTAAIDSQARSRLNAELAKGHGGSIRDPLVSIVIPVQRHRRQLRQCLMSLMEKTEYAHLEIIVMDDKSANGVNQFLNAPQRDKVRWLPTPAGMGVSDACNAAVRQARGELVVFLDPHTSIERGWLEYLLKSATSEPRPSGVTSKVLDDQTRILEAGCSEIEKGEIRSTGELSRANAPDQNYVRSVDSGSLYSILVSRQAFDSVGGMDPKVSCFGPAMVDLGMALRAHGHSVLYQPASVLRIQGSAGVDPADPSPPESLLAKRRPQVTGPLHGQEGKMEASVLVLGIYLANRLNNIQDIVSTLSKSTACRVVQQWVALGGEPPSDAVAAVTSTVLSGRKPKYEILNEMLAAVDRDAFDYVVTMDDDVVLPEGFLDRFIAQQTQQKFVIAQPARTKNSYIDHPIVCQQDGVLARQTLFVEIGPVTSFHRTAFDIVFPFDLTSAMGWGYENVWAYELGQRGLAMGIIDCTPVDHSLRKPVENYAWRDADRERAAFLKTHSHLSLDECFRVIDVKNAEEVHS